MVLSGPWNSPGQAEAHSVGGWEVWEWGRQILALQEGLAPKGPQANPLSGVKGCP